MGDWMSVEIVGTCAADEVAALRKAITTDADLTNFHCLCGGTGIAGLPMWAAEKIDAVGNCAERDYDAESVQRTLEKIAVKVPSLAVKVHCGGPYEDKKCVATVTLFECKATIGAPEVETVREISEAQMQQNFLNSMMNWRNNNPFAR